MNPAVDVQQNMVYNKTCNHAPLFRIHQSIATPMNRIKRIALLIIHNVNASLYLPKAFATAPLTDMIVPVALKINERVKRGSRVSRSDHSSFFAGPTHIPNILFVKCAAPVALVVFRFLSFLIAIQTINFVHLFYLICSSMNSISFRFFVSSTAFLNSSAERGLRWSAKMPLVCWHIAYHTCCGFVVFAAGVILDGGVGHFSTLAFACCSLRRRSRRAFHSRSWW